MEEQAGRHQIERPVGERKVLGVQTAHVDVAVVRELPFGHGKHVRRHVDRGDLRARETPAPGEGALPRPAGDVEDPTRDGVDLRGQEVALLGLVLEVLGEDLLHDRVPGRRRSRLRVPALQTVDRRTHVVRHPRRREPHDRLVPVDVRHHVFPAHARADTRRDLVRNPPFGRLDGHGPSSLRAP